MKSFSPAVGLLAALVVVAGLAACGGYSAINLGGTVTGLTTSGLVLANGTNTVTIPANATSYTFSSQIGNYASYSVSIQTQPQRLTCTVLNPTGTASGVDITYVNVTCTPNTYALGGTVTGLNGTLQLVNGSDTVSVTATGGSTTFTFPTKVADGAVYGVAVLSNSGGQTCTVTEGTAQMGDHDVNTVKVTCT